MIIYIYIYISPPPEGDIIFEELPEVLVYTDTQLSSPIRTD